jgi:hypothetical protein
VLVPGGGGGGRAIHEGHEGGKREKGEGKTVEGDRGLKPTATVVASLRDVRSLCDAWRCGGIWKPWVETHGYRRGVATRRRAM